MTVENTDMTSAGVQSGAINSDSTLMGQANTTQGNGFIDPQVLTAMVSAQLPNYLRFTPLATVDTTLVGRPGTTVTVPRWKYIGEATDVKELGAIPLKQMSASMQSIKIKKSGIGSQYSDEFALSAYGDPVSEIARQVSMSLADRVDSDCMDTLLKAKLTLEATNDIKLFNSLEATFINNTTVGYDTTEATAMLNGVIVLNPQDANDLIASAMDIYKRPTQLGDDVLIKGNGALGEILGWQIVTARKLTKGKAIAMKPGALGIYMKRGVLVETQRDILHKATTVTADEYYATAINDDSKVCAITLTPAVAVASTESGTASK